MKKLLLSIVVSLLVLSGCGKTVVEENKSNENNVGVVTEEKAVTETTEEPANNEKTETAEEPPANEKAEQAYGEIGENEKIQEKTAEVVGEKTTKYLDIPYASVSSAEKLDIYLPPDSGKAFPVIVAIHGGGFMRGDKGDNQVNPMLKGVQRGYAVISVNYRLSGEAIFPAQIEDIKAAIRWVRANAGKYNINPDKMAVWGDSAGGNLASLAGVSGDITELEDLSLGNADFGSRVQAVVDWFGPIDFLTMDEQFVKSGKGKTDHGDADSPESLLMGAKIGDIPDEVKKADPETYITPDDPPFFIEHGTLDHMVPTMQSIIFYNKLVPVLGKDNVTLKLLKGTRHGGPAFTAEENLDLVFAFLDKELKE